jgi:hypothetical protein
MGKVYYDPRASKSRKYSAAGKLICCSGAIVTGILGANFCNCKYCQSFFASYWEKIGLLMMTIKDEYPNIVKTNVKSFDLTNKK